MLNSHCNNNKEKKINKKKICSHLDANLHSKDYITFYPLRHGTPWIYPIKYFYMLQILNRDKLSAISINKILLRTSFSYEYPYQGGPVFDTRSGNILSFLLPLFQEGQLSVTGESMCTKYWLTA